MAIKISHISVFPFSELFSMHFFPQNQSYLDVRKEIHRFPIINYILLSVESKESVLGISLLQYPSVLLKKLFFLLSFCYFLAITSAFCWLSISCFFLNSSFFRFIAFVKAGLSFQATTSIYFSLISSNQEHIIY